MSLDKEAHAELMQSIEATSVAKTTGDPVEDTKTILAIVVLSAMLRMSVPPDAAVAAVVRESQRKAALRATGKAVAAAIPGES